MELFQHIDYGILKWVVTATYQNRWLNPLVFVGAELLIFAYVPVLLVTWVQSVHRIVDKRMGRRAIILAVLAVVTSLIIKASIGHIFARPQPFISHPDLFVMNVAGDRVSFPSTYAIIAFAVAFSFRLSGYTLLGDVLLAGAFIICLAQIMAGVHYPSDVLAGGLLAGAVSWSLRRERSRLKQYIRYW